MWTASFAEFGVAFGAPTAVDIHIDVSIRKWRGSTRVNWVALLPRLFVFDIESIQECV